MLEQAFNWFLTTHAQILRKGDKCGFEVSNAHVDRTCVWPVHPKGTG